MSTTVTTRNEDGTDERTTSTTNTIDQAGRRTAITTNDSNGDGEQRAEQAWNAAGNLLTDRDNNRTSYNTDNKPVTITNNNGTTTTSYWADGSRKTLTTIDANGANEQTTTFHYTPAGTIANDSTKGLTASYLLTPYGREHRALTHNGVPV
ncbi:hypothetical protein, partial [Kitasatospora sp. MBT63]|uniref:hypothetical protein n=1 Tax=Kitasatospora sp. MBT63 TaxID=1444768 RepID=UPI0018F49A5E